MEYTAEHETVITLRKLIFLMESLPDDMRLNVMQEIKEHYCEYCGTNHYNDLRPCQCWNDD